MHTRPLSFALLLIVLFGSIQECLCRTLPLASFTSATQIEAGGAAVYRVVIGDVNGDKLPDIVTLVQNSASPTGTYLAVMLGTGNGNVDVPVLTPVSFGPGQFVIVADVNNDGKDDVILVHPNSADVLLSKGDGTFETPQTFATGISSPVAAALWDVNHDKIQDLVVVDGQSEQAVFLLGNGKGGFGSPQLTSFPGQATGGVLADVDQDGNLDFVTNTNVYFGNGSGGFLAGTPLQSNDGQNAGAVSSDSIFVGDVNGDGRPDVVTANGNWNSISVFLNQGNRELVQYGASQWAANDPVGIALADLNWDGKLDIIVTSGTQSDLTVLLGNGDGTFLAPTPGFATGGSPSTRAVFADFYGDGNLDALVADNLFSVVLERGFGDGTFNAAPDTNIVVNTQGTNYYYGALSIATADFNGDGIPDFAVGQSLISSGTGFIVFLGQKDGSLGKGSVYGLGTSPSYVAAGDINQDGKVDLVASDWWNGGVAVFLDNGDGTFQSPVLIPLTNAGKGLVAADFNGHGRPDVAAGGFTNGLVIADFNGDGWPDVAVVGNDSLVYILLNDGHGSLVPSGNYLLSGTGYELAAADINHDGKLDLCVAMTSTTRVAILLGNGDGTFTAAPDYDTTLPTPYGIALGDTTGHGNVDLIVSSPSSGKITVALGNGDGTFGPPTAYPATLSASQVNPSPGEVALADLKKDGYLDIIYANTGYSTVGVLMGEQGGGFYGPTEYPVGGGALAVAIADLNKDGWLDVVTADSNFSGVSVLYNTSGVQPTTAFSVGANPSAVTVNSGGTTATTITLTSINSFFGSVDLSCSDLPAVLSCTFAPSVAHVEKNGAVSSQLSITAVQSHAALSSSGQPLMALAIGPILGVVFCWRIPRVSRKASLLVLLASLVVFSGCQSLAPSSHVGPQTYTITVTAAAWNGTSHSAQVQVTVQQ